VVATCRKLFIAKNSDYGSAWLDMRPESITDIIGYKQQRAKRMEELRNQGKNPKVSEGVGSEFMDIFNYSIFELILLGLQGMGPFGYFKEQFDNLRSNNGKSDTIR
ncbi:DUF1599 domain-containing protein, partial [Patescibacteria group bacterium]|nr:DUF1599 domain-containing protein [Patescibacteria group bacterium]